MRRTFNDALISVGALAALLLTLVAADDRVREQLSARFSGGPSQQIANASSQVSDLMTVVATAARHQSLEHAPLMLFVVAATVLVLFMLRT
jgi:hypothetical protein